MPSPASQQPASQSGIRQLSNGESVIPASTRADGSVRKEIRVRPGYRPPEDVEVYKNRTAEAWKNRGKGGVPGAEPTGEEKGASPNASAAAAKNAKRREARKKAAAAATEDGTDTGAGSGPSGAADGVDTKKESAESTTQDTDPEAERAKEARKLAKKLRQARDLQQKKKDGDGMLPEQLLKVTRIHELIRQLDLLGFDQEGEKKQQPSGNGVQPAD